MPANRQPTNRAPLPPPLLPDGSPVPAGPGVYLLHSVDANGHTARYGHAGHYTGHASDLPTRIREELAGGPRAARLVQVMRQAGLNLLVTRVWQGATRDDERALKRRGGAAKHCPRCLAERPATRGRLPLDSLYPHINAVETFVQLNPSFVISARTHPPQMHMREQEASEALGHKVISGWAQQNQPSAARRQAAVRREARFARALARRTAEASRTPQLGQRHHKAASQGAGQQQRPSRSGAGQGRAPHPRRQPSRVRSDREEAERAR